MIASVASTAEEKNGPGTKAPAELLEQQREIEQLQLGAAVGLRHDQPHPARAPPSGDTARAESPPRRASTSRTKLGGHSLARNSAAERCNNS